MSNTTVNISAMDLRESPGMYLDRVDYRNESFIIERAGKQKAALVPLYLYNAVEEARKQLFVTNEEIARAFTNEDPARVQKEIKKAIKAVRNEN